MKSIVLVVSLLVALTVNNAQAAVITNLSNLDINGTLYDVTFHADPATFRSLWDGNGDGTVGDGSLGKTPEFWGDATGAIDAAEAIITALGDVDTVVGGNGDNPYVPYTFVIAPNTVRAASDFSSQPDIDSLVLTLATPTTLQNNANGGAWVSFAPASAVPLPFTPALLFAGLLAAGVTRRIRRAD